MKERDGTTKQICTSQGGYVNDAVHIRFYLVGLLFSFSKKAAKKGVCGEWSGLIVLDLSSVTILISPN